MIEDRVLTAEAKKRGTTTGQTGRRRRSIEKSKRQPDDEIVKFYEANKGRIGKSLADTARDIRDYLMEREHDRLFACIYRDVEESNTT
jgi:hypothetical protein